MAKIEAVFDGRAFHPSEPVPLEPNTRVRITVEAVDVDENGRRSFFRTASALGIEGPPDWAENLEEYLYGEAAVDAK